MPLRPGSVLHNRYRIEGVLGQGGMGAVYRASDVNLGVAVAVKENLFTTEEYARQFHREATILASLRHPNLPRVTDHFVIEGQGQYLVMDFVEGGDLRQRLETSGPVSEQEALPWFLDICDALIYLHTRPTPIIHRDIKPGNIKLTPENRAMLVDFGLAKFAEAHGNTTTGAKAMTPGFSPPEQYGTGRTDPRSDIYSLGASLYAALTATVPEDALERAMGRVQLTPVRKRNPEVSNSTARAIEKALAIRPEERYQTASELGAALGATIGASRPTKVHPYPQLNNGLAVNGKVANGLALPRPRLRLSRRQIAIGLGGLALLFILAGASYAAPELKQRLARWLSEPPPTAARTQTEAEPSATPTGFAVFVPPTSSPEGGGPTASPVSEPSPTAAILPTAVATPTGGGYGQIAFVSDRSGDPQIYLVNIDGTGVIQVTDLQDGACQPSWSPDGMSLVFTSPCPGNRERYPGSSLWIINVNRSGLRPLPTVPGGDYDPAWSPLGDRIAFTSLRDGRAQIYVMDVDGTNVRNLSQNQAWDSQPAWSPDGSQILFTTSRAGPTAIWIMTADGESQRALSRSNELANSDPDWAGQLILYQQKIGGIPRLVVMRYQDFLDQRFTETRVCQQGQLSAQPMAEPRWSLDGKWIAIETWPTGVNHDIALLSLSCTNANYSELITDPASEFDAAWRP
ncbi:MAG: protein kinase [Chloroflexota bacterium]